MADLVCPWWIGVLLASPIRKLFQDPHKILSPYVRPGMTVLEPGPGMGFFTLELARLVGPTGKVIAVDLEPKMLDGLRRRAQKAGLSARIETRQSTADSLGVEDLKEAVDFVLAFAMVHELPDASSFFAQVQRTLRARGELLFCEPSGHVSQKAFSESLEKAKAQGFSVRPTAAAPRSHSALLVKEA